MFEAKVIACQITQSKFICNFKMKDYAYFKIDLHSFSLLLHIVHHLPSPICGGSETLYASHSAFYLRKKGTWGGCGGVFDNFLLVELVQFMHLTVARAGTNKWVGR